MYCRLSPWGIYKSAYAKQWLLSVEGWRGSCSTPCWKKNLNNKWHLCVTWVPTCTACELALPVDLGTFCAKSVRTNHMGLSGVGGFTAVCRFFVHNRDGCGWWRAEGWIVLSITRNWVSSKTNKGSVPYHCRPSIKPFHWLVSVSQTTSVRSWHRQVSVLSCYPQWSRVRNVYCLGTTGVMNLLVHENQHEAKHHW